MSRFLSTTGLARLSARRPWRILGLWLVILVLAGVAQSGLSDVLTSEDSFANKPESVRGADLLEERLRGPEPLTETVIVRSETATVDDPAFRAVVEQTTAELRGLDGVVAAAGNYYEAEGEAAAGMVSADRHASIIPVTLAGELDDVSPHAEEYLDAVAAHDGNGYEVMTVGGLSSDEEFGKIMEEDLAKGEGIGIGVALIVLVVLFGALVAAGVPLVLAMASIFVSLGLTALVGRIFELSDIVQNIITMIGLAVGIDYALFIVERYREERRRGLAKHEAIERAGGTATRAVVFSGFTVIIALLGMLVVPMSVFRSLGIGAALVVVVAVLASMTVVPAMLSLLGDKIDWPRRKKYDAATAAAEAARDRETVRAGFWGRITRVVMARPVVSAILATALLVAAALPVLDLNTGLSGVESLPEGEVKSAYEILEREFYAGMLAPVEIVVDGRAGDPAVQTGVDNLVAALGQDELYGPAMVETNETGDLTLVSVPMSVDSSAPEAETAIGELRDEIVPRAFAGAPGEVVVLVSGEAAFNLDFNEMMSDYMPLVFAFVLGLSFILLMLAFRSIVVPVTAIVMNLLSVGAAYGLLVLVFQKGYGADFFGFQQVSTIESWLPIFLFSILFGLSMDYHVFLLSRIREHYDQTFRNGESVAHGLQATAKIITGAALIMVAVFGGFAAGRLVSLQQVGFGLAVAVFLDATVVRSVLVPATMAFLGDRNWYLPRWLRWLPDLRVEGGAHPAPAPVAEPVAVPATAATAVELDKAA